MTRCALVLLVVTLALPAGAAAADKPITRQSPPPPDPGVIRQGGDTIADAVPLTIPTDGLAGTTTGYSDDYDLPYPYGGGTAPDVVYSFVPSADMLIDVDLCESSYDTKVWIWDASTSLPPIAWNDDSYEERPDCGVYTSLIERASVQGGVEYFLIVDGYGSDHGDYVLDVHPSPTCGVTCPAGAVLEGEPPLVPEYDDQFNAGCWADLDDPPVQPLTGPVLCGVSGWYTVGTDIADDVDFFAATVPAGGQLAVTLSADFTTRLAVASEPDCATGYVVQTAYTVDCSEQTLIVEGEPGATVWLVVSPYTELHWPLNTGAYEYTYTLTLDHDPVAVERTSWSTVKGMFGAD